MKIIRKFILFLFYILICDDFSILNLNMNKLLSLSNSNSKNNNYNVNGAKYNKISREITKKAILVIEVLINQKEEKYLVEMDQLKVTMQILQI